MPGMKCVSVVCLCFGSDILTFCKDDFKQLLVPIRNAGEGSNAT